MTNNMKFDVCKSKRIKEYVEKISLHPDTQIEKRLYRLRNKYTAATNYSPTKTRGVIYCLYGIGKDKNSPLYVGKTIRTAYERMINELQVATSYNSNTQISKYIRMIGRYNIGVFVLQKIDDDEHLDYFERKWIHKLETHINIKDKIALNNNPETKPLIHKKREINKYKHNKQVDTNTEVCAIMKIVKTVIYLAQYKDIFDKPPPPITTINLANLYKILSVCIGKAIYHKPKPISKIESDKIKNSHEYINHIIPEKTIHTLIQYINQQIITNIELLKINGHKTKKSFPKFNICSIIFMGEINNQIKLSKILNKYIHMLPPPMNYITEPIVIYKNRPTTSKYLYNHKKEVLLINKDKTQINATCQCHNINIKYKRNGHVITGDMNVIKEIVKKHNEEDIHKLTELMKLGTKYIEKPSTNKKLFYNNYAIAVEDFTNKLIKYHKNNKEIKQYTKWKEKILQSIKTNLDEYTNINNTLEITRQYRIKGIISQIHKNYVITCVDKMPNNYSIICKHEWLTALYDSTLDTKQTSYITTNLTEEEIIKRHKKYLNDNKFKTYSKLPIKYITPKLHKEGWRPICAAPGVTTTYLAKTLAVAINMIIIAIKQDANLIKMRTGINTYYDIENATDVKYKIEEINNENNNTNMNIETADITGWYDNIQHFDAIRVISKIIYETFIKIKRRLYIRIKGKEAIWTNKHTESTYFEHCLSAANILKLIVWRLRNQYSKIGNIIVKQVIGTGQGDNHSGHLCRLISICYERKFATYWAMNDRKIALQFNNTIRKHDDYAFFNNNNVIQYLYRTNKRPGLLPKYFSLKWTNQTKDKANYLDTTIHTIDNPYKYDTSETYYTILQNKKLMELRDIAKEKKLKQHGNKEILISRILQLKRPVNNYHNKDKIWNIKTYNKKDEFKINFHINSFPYYNTNLIKHSKTGAVTGQLHSYLITNGVKYDDFINNVIKLFTQLCKINKYPIRILNDIFVKFITNKKEIYFKGDKEVTVDYYSKIHHLWPP